ncbi:hypothetical protein AX15_005257 [Amanita polypyramis BW_CC]|nr:hypothetical protein AX15_005257 [Amanita polypyramis BW_CC]
MATLEEYIASQEDLVKEAALALPHEFSRCTYSLGYIRHVELACSSHKPPLTPCSQAVYLCLSCPEQRGICSACSIACHTDHEQLELFPKRHFRCDCPTPSIAHSCTLHTKSEEENAENLYGPNFTGVFCRCGRPYDAKMERETMIQCLACEDWFHESCCNLRERPLSREPTPVPGDESNQTEDNASDASLDLPPALLTASDYGSFVCGACASKSKLLRRWAGTPGVIMVIRDSSEQPWRPLEAEQMEFTNRDGTEISESSRTGMKRPLPDGTDGPHPKRPRVPLISAGACLAPLVNPVAQRIFADLSTAKSPCLGTGDLFLTEGFRDRWCRCKSCSLLLNAYPYLLEEEDAYEPPEDPDSGLSLEELGLRALSRIPRDQAIDGIHAFNNMRNELVNYLRPFAQEGKVVSESDVRSFFDSLTEGRNPK